MTKLIFHYRNWLRLPRWIAEPRKFWLCIGGVILASLVGEWFGMWILDPFVRTKSIVWSGWMLEVFGLALVAAGLNNRLDLYDGKSLWSLLRDSAGDWWQRCPIIRRDRVVHVGSANLTLQPFVATGYATVKIDPNKSCEEKVDWLLDQHYQLVKGFHDFQKTISDKEADLDKRLEQLRDALEQTIGEVQAQTKKAQIGEIGSELVGLVWIFFGISFATVPGLVEHAFGWLIEWVGIL